MTCNLQATLLVIKQENNCFIPLDSRDKPNYEEIGNVFLRYEWPMVITNSSLTENEKNELLTSDQEYAEEKFIRKKLKEIDPMYDVVFIPTSFYEMFILTKYYDDMDHFQATFYGNNDFENQYYSTYKNDWYQFFRDVYYGFGEIYNVCIKYIACSTAFNQHNIYLDEIINDHDLAYHEKYEKIYSLFQRINNKYYPQAFLCFNNAVTKLLFESYTDLAFSAHGNEISQKIELNLDQIAMLFSDTRVLDMHKDFHLISQVLLLEYEARTLNKALLFRGTSKIIQCIEGEDITLIGSTIYDCSSYMYTAEINQELCTCKDSINPYSISFGNSLFAGLLHDPCACAYTFLKIHEQGYSLFINKKDYREHQCSDLFYIAPLNAIAGLVGWGEWFHSRSKATMIADKQSKYIDIHGLVSEGLIDTAGIILITRDPLEHAELFSQYVADNMRYIQRFILPEDNQGDLIEKIDYPRNQKTAAQYYFILKTLHELGF